MKVIKEGKKNRYTTAEIEAPCCGSVLEVTYDDVVATEHGCHDFICGYCETRFSWQSSWFNWSWARS